MKYILILFAFCSVPIAFGQTLKVPLKSGAAIQGRLVAKTTDQVVLETEYGEVKFRPADIEPHVWDALQKATTVPRSGRKSIQPNHPSVYKIIGKGNKIEKTNQPEPEPVPAPKLDLPTTPTTPTAPGQPGQPPKGANANPGPLPKPGAETPPGPEVKPPSSEEVLDRYRQTLKKP